jgi:Ca-activated chloride channel homolog
MHPIQRPIPTSGTVPRYTLCPRPTRPARCLATPRQRLRRAAAVLFLLSLFTTAHATDDGATLELRADGGWGRALLLDSAVEMHVSGLIAEVVLRQRYVNDSELWLEGRYLLPLPERAAVGRLRVRIGERLIEGEIRERGEARAVFAAAAQDGRRAAVVEQHRPDLFRTGLTNIGPGEEIEVEIGYWQPVDYRDGEFGLDLPLTLTPRYHSTAGDLLLDGAAFAGDLLPLDADPFRAATLPSQLEPNVTITVELRAGLPLSRVYSPTHRIATDLRDGVHRVELADLVEASDRTFELRWQPLPSALPQRALFVEEVDGEHYALVLLLPPTAPVAPLPREMILVIDHSGSMHGAAMQQAIAALDNALTRLRPGERFNVVRFNHQSEALFAGPVPVDPGTIATARRFVAGLAATGGTEMHAALSLAFAGAPPPGFVRQVVLATDAAIGNEQALFAQIERERGAARLFPVGIGSAPNGHFIRKAAELGRGSQTTIRAIGDVAARMDALFTRLDRPLLQDLDLQWPDAHDVYPARLPDLYAGEPLQVLARLPLLQGELALSGRSRERPWHSRMRLDAQLPTPAAGVGRLWARARIDMLEDAARDGADPGEVRRAIVETALTHGITSRHTSLVAVEKTPARPSTQPLATTDIANAAPADTLALAQGSTPARSRLGLAVALLLLGAAVLRRRDAPAALELG